MQASVLVSPQLDEELAEKGVEDLKHLANHMSKQVCHTSAPCSAATGVQAAMMQPESSPGPDVCMLVFWLSCEQSLQGLVTVITGRSQPPSAALASLSWCSA